MGWFFNLLGAMFPTEIEESQSYTTTTPHFDNVIAYHNGTRLWSHPQPTETSGNQVASYPTTSTSPLSSSATKGSSLSSSAIASTLLPTSSASMASPKRISPRASHQNTDIVVGFVLFLVLVIAICLAVFFCKCDGVAKLINHFNSGGRGPRPRRPTRPEQHPMRDRIVNGDGAAPGNPAGNGPANDTQPTHNPPPGPPTPPAPTAPTPGDLVDMFRRIMQDQNLAAQWKQMVIPHLQPLLTAHLATQIGQNTTDVAMLATKFQGLSAYQIEHIPKTVKQRVDTHDLQITKEQNQRTRELKTLKSELQNDFAEFKKDVNGALDNIQDNANNCMTGVRTEIETTVEDHKASAARHMKKLGVKINKSIGEVKDTIKDIETKYDDELRKMKDTACKCSDSSSKEDTEALVKAHIDAALGPVMERISTLEREKTEQKNLVKATQADLTGVKSKNDKLTAKVEEQAAEIARLGAPQTLTLSSISTQGTPPIDPPRAPQMAPKADTQNSTQPATTTAKALALAPQAKETENVKPAQTATPSVPAPRSDPGMTPSNNAHPTASNKQTSASALQAKGKGDDSAKGPKPTPVAKKVENEGAGEKTSAVPSGTGPQSSEPVTPSAFPPQAKKEEVNKAGDKPSAAAPVSGTPSPSKQDSAKNAASVEKGAHETPDAATPSALSGTAPPAQEVSDPKKAAETTSSVVVGGAQKANPEPELPKAQVPNPAATEPPFTIPQNHTWDISDMVNKQNAGAQDATKQPENQVYSLFKNFSPAEAFAGGKQGKKTGTTKASVEDSSIRLQPSTNPNNLSSTDATGPEAIQRNEPEDEDEDIPDAPPTPTQPASGSIPLPIFNASTMIAGVMPSSYSLQGAPPPNGGFTFPPMAGSTPNPLIGQQSTGFHTLVKTPATFSNATNTATRDDVDMGGTDQAGTSDDSEMLDGGKDQDEPYIEKDQDEPDGMEVDTQPPAQGITSIPVNSVQKGNVQAATSSAGGAPFNFGSSSFGNSSFGNASFGSFTAGIPGLTLGQGNTGLSGKATPGAPFGSSASQNGISSLLTSLVKTPTQGPTSPPTHQKLVPLPEGTIISPERRNESLLLIYLAIINHVCSQYHRSEFQYEYTDDQCRRAAMKCEQDLAKAFTNLSRVRAYAKELDAWKKALGPNNVTFPVTYRKFKVRIDGYLNQWHHLNDTKYCLEAAEHHMMPAPLHPAQTNTTVPDLQRERQVMRLFRAGSAPILEKPATASPAAEVAGMAIQREKAVVMGVGDDAQKYAEQMVLWSWNYKKFNAKNLAAWKGEVEWFRSLPKA